MNNKIILIIAISLLAGVLVGAMLFRSPKEAKAPVSQELAETEEELVVTEEPAEETPTVPEEKEYTPPPKKTEEPTPPPAQQPDRPLITKEGVYLIYYTDNGFYPLKIIIPTGTIVHFINDSDKAMKVFATDYLKDAKYAALNQSKTASRGDYYSYTFLKEGNWNYYNNYFSSHTGSIVVY